MGFFNFLWLKSKIMFIYYVLNDGQFAALAHTIYDKAVGGE